MSNRMERASRRPNVKGVVSHVFSVERDCELALECGRE